MRPLCSLLFALTCRDHHPDEGFGVDCDEAPFVLCVFLLTVIIDIHLNPQVKVWLRAERANVSLAATSLLAISE